MNTNNREFKVLTDIEHVLLRPQMYIGAVNLIEQNVWVLNKDTNKFNFTTIKFVPSLLKCANELIDNSIDVAIDTNFKCANIIKVNVDNKSIEVIDNGIGIPCTVPKGAPSNETRTCAELAWTTLKSGTSFDNNRNKIGTNGVGSSCVAIFSKVFIGKSDDGTYKQTITCKNNLSEKNISKITKSSGKSGVTVYCEPDLDRFGLTEIDQIHKDLIYQRLINLSICYPKIKFIFNGKLININYKKFAELFSDYSEVINTNNTTICIFPNEQDEFRFYSCINGLDTVRGGTHVDFIISQISNKLRDKLIKKYKSIKPGDIKNKLSLVIMMTNFKNCQFDSQTKESLTNNISDITKHLGSEIDFDKFSKQILKNDKIIEPIIETFKIKEEFKARQELKKVKRIKIKSDKYMPPIGKHKYLALCEGQSASSNISACLGRNEIGYYAMRGIPLNCYDSTIQKIASNQEFKDIFNILDLDISSHDKKTISFEKILITTDNDSDAAHITAMLIGCFKRFSENLFNEGKICKLITPLIIIEDKNGKIIKYFFNVNDFKIWESQNPNNKNKIVYLKGLGSWDPKQLDELIQREGINKFIFEYHLDELGNIYIEDWLGPDATKRKKYLREYSLDINSI